MIRHIRAVMSLLAIGACVALVAIWIRSYIMADRLHGRIWGRQSFVIASKQGHVTVVGHRWAVGMFDRWRWEVLSFPASSARSFPVPKRTYPVGNIRMYDSAIGFGVIQNPLMYKPFHEPPDTPTSTADGLLGPVKVEFVEGFDIIDLSGPGFTPLDGAGVIVPFWFLVLVTGICLAGSQMRSPWRYSIRALLMTFTFIGVLVGLVTILDRPPIPNDEVTSTSDDVIELIRALNASPNR